VADQAPGAGMGAEDAALFGVAATLVYTIFSANCSSPQTTELFAGERAGTLWSYVRMAGWQSALLVGIMAVRGGSAWPALGGGLTGGILWWTYAHALKAGSGQPPPTGDGGDARTFYVKGR
jgi:hypothetical protein